MGHSPGNVERDDDREMKETVKCELEHEASRNWVRVTLHTLYLSISTVRSGGWEKTTLIVLEKDEFYDDLWRLF